MGRSFNGLVTFTRMDASPYLSSVKARLSGGSRRCETGSGSCAFQFPSAFKAASYWDENSGFVNPGAISSLGGAALNFDSTYSSGAAVESTPAALPYAVGKEM